MLTIDTTGKSTQECGHCGGWHQGACPRVKAVEYYRDGTVKRVEYHDQQPVVWPITPEMPPWPYGPICTQPTTPFIGDIHVGDLDCDGTTSAIATSYPPGSTASYTDDGGRYTTTRRTSGILNLRYAPK